MSRLRALFLAAGLGLTAAMPALAVQPDEILPDPAMEARARTISAQLRCMVCQNQSIDDSDAELARDLRVLVRERLVAGDSNQAVFDFVVSRYGEFVLLKPRLSARNALLWAAPFGLLAVGGVYLAMRGRRKAAGSGARPLDEAEKAELDRILKGN